MDGHRVCLRALHLLSLIAYFQVPSSLARPLSVVYERTDEAPETDCPPEEQPPAPTWTSVGGIDYTSPSSSIPPTSDDWQPTAYVIGDGQVQAAYTVSTEEIVVTSSGTTVVSSSTVTNYYSYTPRQLTSDWSTTSTSTLYVVASPTLTSSSTTSVTSPSSSSTAVSTTTTTGTLTTTTPGITPQSLTTSLPNSLLTSLTTSEVQTVPAAPPTDTSGVSIPFSPSDRVFRYDRGGGGQIATMVHKRKTCDLCRRFDHLHSAVRPDRLSGHEYFTRSHQVSRKRHTNHILVADSTNHIRDIRGTFCQSVPYRFLEKLRDTVTG